MKRCYQNPKLQDAEYEQDEQFVKEIISHTSKLTKKDVIVAFVLLFLWALFFVLTWNAIVSISN